MLRFIAESWRGRAEGDIVNCESVLGKMGRLSVSSYSPHSMRAIHYVPLGPLTPIVFRMPSYLKLSINSGEGD